MAKTMFKETVPYPAPHQPKFTFIDLFSGVGGIRIALQELGGKCLFSSEWDKYAKETYCRNFGELPHGDIKQFTDSSKVTDKELDRLIPDHDILTAGFPCQPFSLAGVSKKNSLGRAHGFADPTQGTLFFDIKRILRVKRPKAFLLENVKNLLTHDEKQTFGVIKKALKDELGYVVKTSDIVVDGKEWVPQHRERIFIVGYNPRKITVQEEDIIIPKKPKAGYQYKELRDIIRNTVDDKYTLGPGTWDTLKRHKEHHKKSGNGFGYGILKRPIVKGTVTRTMSARYHKDGAEILVAQRGKRPRKLSIDEAMELMGFNPRKFIFPVSLTQAYRQLGNSVIIPAVKETAREIVKIIKKKH